jgi:lysophospholipase L1-like esterase
MNSKTSLFPQMRAALALLAACVAGSQSLAGVEAAVLVPASDTRIAYEGRFDFSNRREPVVIWQASRIRVDFEADGLDLRFGPPQGQSFFNARVDSVTTRVALVEGKPPSGLSLRGLGKGRHTLELFKRSEASAGTVAFLGIALPAGGSVWAPAPPSYALAMEFIGDSITAGACDEDGGADQWDDRSTHDNARSYGAVTSAAFHADYRNIAVSGMGVCAGYTEVKAAEAWDGVYPSATSPRADLSAWTPDVVFVNLGENDDSFTRIHQQPFPAGYTEGYVSLVHAIRRAHPGAQIVLLRGGMFGGAQSPDLRKAWEAAVTRLEASDGRIFHFVFSHWTRNHPRVADHEAMAGELIAWLRLQGFMAARR